MLRPVFGGCVVFLAGLSLGCPAFGDVVGSYGPSVVSSSGVSAPGIVRGGSGVNGEQQQAVGNLGEAVSPSDVVAPLGATAQFSASVTNPSADMKVRWQVSYDGKNWRDVPGGDTTKLSVVFLSDADNGTKYRAVFSRGGSSVTTNSATLTIGSPVDSSSGGVSGGSTSNPLGADSSQAQVVSTAIDPKDTKVNEWLRSHQNKMWIWNNSPYGAQCVDLFDYYFQDMTGQSPPMVVGAKDLWSMPGNMSTYFEQVPASETPQQGDVAIWGSSWGGGYGHVAIVVKPEDNGNVQVLANNVDGSASEPALVNDSSTSGLLGYLRLKDLSGSSGATDSGAGSKGAVSSSGSAGGVTSAGQTDIEKLPWSDEVFAVGVNSENTTVRQLSSSDMKYLDNPKVKTVKDVPGTKYYTGGKAGVIWGVTPNNQAVELSYDQWKQVGSPKPVREDALYVKYSWDDQVWMAVPINGGKGGILWKPLNQAQYVAEGSPRVQDAGYITGTTFYKSWSSDDIYARSAGGKVHKLSYGEWLRAGSPEPQVIED